MYEEAGEIAEPVIEAPLGEEAPVDATFPAIDTGFDAPAAGAGGLHVAIAIPSFAVIFFAFYCSISVSASS